MIGEVPCQGFAASRRLGQMRSAHTSALHVENRQRRTPIGSFQISNAMARASPMSDSLFSRNSFVILDNTGRAQPRRVRRRDRQGWSMADVQRTDL